MTVLDWALWCSAIGFGIGIGCHDLWLAVAGAIVTNIGIQLKARHATG